MVAKTIEIRDSGTFIPALAIRLAPGCEADRYLLARAGYGTDPSAQASYVILMRLTSPMAATYDPAHWLADGTRTLHVAHRWIREHFDEVRQGGVIDVEFILGETPAPKVSENPAAWPEQPIDSGPLTATFAMTHDEFGRALSWLEDAASVAEEDAAGRRLLDALWCATQ